jgi:outer membrane protein
VVQEKVREQAYVTGRTNLPQVNFSYVYTPSQRFPLIRIPPGIFGPDETTFQANFQRQNIVGFDMTQPIYTGGRIRNTQAIQESGLDASRLELERSRQDLQYRVVEVFYNALLKQQGVGVSDEQIRLSETQLALARARYEAGTVARLDVLQAEVQLANARARRIQIKAEVDVALQAVRTVLALPQGRCSRWWARSTRVGKSPGARSLTYPRDPTCAPSRHAATRPSIARLADGEWKPSLAFRGTLQYRRIRSAQSSTPRTRTTHSLAIQVPLMAAPGAAARRTVAQAQKRQAEHGLNASTDQARLELETAWTTLQAAAEVVTTQQKALELARESVQIAQVSYENGVITSAELNDAQVRMLETEWTLLQAKFAKIVAAARAKVAAGVE